MVNYIISIDPGATGAMCLMEVDNNVVKNINFIDFKTDGLEGYINRLKMIDSNNNTNIIQIGIESVHSMPKQGVSSTFTFGQRLGELVGMLKTLKLGYEAVTPVKWQRLVGIKPKSGKSGIYESISRLYPRAELKGPKGGILDGRCDALGIAHYLRIRYTGGVNNGDNKK